MFSPSVLLLLLLTTVTSGVHCIELTQPASMVVTPGQSMSLTCTVSGFSLSSYWTHWIRQPAGQALEWIGQILGGGRTYYSDKLKSRFQLTVDTSSSTVTLRGENLQAGDTAVYYCAREPHSETHQHRPCTKTPAVFKSPLYRY
ncbi:hypothetical protein NFI96_015736 [Prochilodus magdalenae]|nr:hypothetical protein NFI96_015736 [Prochilodus magdalenae]